MKKRKQYEMHGITKTKRTKTMARHLSRYVQNYVIFCKGNSPFHSIS